MNETEYDSLCWITIAGLLLTFGGLVLQAALKSRCHDVRCGCFECIRDVGAEDSQDVELGVADFTSRCPWFETEIFVSLKAEGVGRMKL